ncbi:hypothetical protein YC2023_083599 [Brassica napus]
MPKQSRKSIIHDIANPNKQTNKHAIKEIVGANQPSGKLRVQDYVKKVYFQLETLSQGDIPYKSVAALNCIILGCANTWDLDRISKHRECKYSLNLSATNDLDGFETTTNTRKKLQNDTFLTKRKENSWA